jgi:glutamate-1-semialdehyde 2,1-aminomutase
MSALRLARAFTGRNKVIKFAGCYHGHHDSLLAQAGSGLATFGIPISPGVPPSFTQETIIAPYNDLEAVDRIFDKYSGEIAAVIVEPVAANMGVVPPTQGFLEGLRQLTDKNESLLIFDEVITGFRVAYGGAQTLYGITPDITCLGKIIGGGLPVGAYGGRREIMEMVAPEGQVYQAGTLSGNPVAMTAGIETLKILSAHDTYVQLEERSAQLADGLQLAAAGAEVSVFISRVGSILTVFFTSQEVVDYESARSSDADLYARFFHSMLDKGIYLPPSQFEALFISLAHSEKDIELTVKAAERAFKACLQ